MLRDNIVSVWSLEKAGEFCGSAFRLGGRHILTAEHVVRDLGTPFIDFIDESERRVPAKVLSCCQKFDAALLELQEEPPREVLTPWLLDVHANYLDEQVTLLAVSPDSYERAPNSIYRISTYNKIRCDYELQPDVARGHSGGVIVRRGTVVGLVFARTRDAPLAHAISLHVLFPWIKERLPKLLADLQIAEAQALEDARIQIDQILKFEAFESLRQRWDPMVLRSARLQELVSLIRSFGDAIARSRTSYWRLRYTLPGQLCDIARALRAVLARLCQLAVCAIAARGELQKDRGWHARQCKSASTVALIQSRVCSAREFEISPDPPDERNRFSVLDTVDSACVDPGYGTERDEFVLKQIWREIRPWEPLNEREPLRPDQRERLLSELESVRPGRSRVIVTEVVGPGGRSPTLERLRENWPIDAIPRTGTPGDFLLVSEEDLNHAVSQCLRAIHDVLGV